VLTQLPHILLEYTIQHTTYLLPAGYSVVFHDRCPASKQSTNHLYCVSALDCNISNQYTTLSHTNSLIGFVVRTAPPVSLCIPALPFGAWAYNSFHYTSFIVTTTGLISDR